MGATPSRKATPDYRGCVRCGSGGREPAFCDSGRPGLWDAQSGSLFRALDSGSGDPSPRFVRSGVESCVEPRLRLGGEHDTAGAPAEIVATNVIGTLHVLLAAEARHKPQVHPTPGKHGWSPRDDDALGYSRGYSRDYFRNYSRPRFRTPLAIGAAAQRIVARPPRDAGARPRAGELGRWVLGGAGRHGALDHEDCRLAWWQRQVSAAPGSGGGAPGCLGPRWGLRA
jgi:hypothetical protein